VSSATDYWDTVLRAQRSAHQATISISVVNKCCFDKLGRQLGDSVLTMFGTVCSDYLDGTCSHPYEREGKITRTFGFLCGSDAASQSVQYLATGWFQGQQSLALPTSAVVFLCMCPYQEQSSL